MHAYISKTIPLLIYVKKQHLLRKKEKSVKTIYR